MNGKINRSIRKMVKGLAVGMAMTVMFAGIAGAGATEDTVVLIVTPIFNLSVNISSGVQQFGAADVNLGESRTLCVGNICNDGNITSYWQKKSDNTLAPTTDWTLLNSGTPTKNNFRLLAVTTGTGVRPDFTDTYTTVDDNVLIAGNHASNDYNVTNDWTNLTEGSGAMEHEAYADGLSTRSLWVSIMMPKTITSQDTQSITLSVKAITQ